MEFIIGNYQWIFSGIGVFIISVFLSKKYTKKNNKNSSINKSFNNINKISNSFNETKYVGKDS